MNPKSMEYFSVNQAEKILEAYSRKADRKRTEEQVIEMRKIRFKQIRSFLSEEDLQDFEKLKEKAEKSLKHHYRQLKESHKTRNRTERFPKLENPEVGMKVHVSWADKGAVFVIKRLDPLYAYLDNPKNKRKYLLKVRRTELHHLAK